jgi:hypothetical protein
MPGRRVWVFGVCGLGIGSEDVGLQGLGFWVSSLGTSGFEFWVQGLGLIDWGSMTG